ncbi:hypothetical protein D3P07_08925 [Paenibacillus sp. 1011MAR3C5]|uniref:hypothetical protein n=1 Tax=Paenibacillus sp. 1011MAR3C5 TaxID=1675787 RepID=UPI000E6B9CB8|nr:hypothetical protein [Paenibacillus sp. 1011MAR3C5]RJE90315.1 hypothetical protein D3P07_08925 [Paenibacillus sp. 1011MAR3C5]
MKKQVAEGREGHAGSASQQRWLIGICSLILIAGVAIVLQMGSNKSKSFPVPAAMAQLKLTLLGNEISSSYKLAGPAIVNDFQATVTDGELEALGFTMVTRMKGGSFKLVNAHLNRIAVREESLRTRSNTTEHWSSFDESVSASQLFVKLDQLQNWVRGHSSDYSLTVSTQKYLYALDADYYQLTNDGVVPLREPLSIASYAAIIQETSDKSQAVVYFDEY